jgi:transposase
MKNKYVKRSKISEAKFREILKYFSRELDAKTIAVLAGLNRNTINKYLHLIRERIAQFCERNDPFNGEIEEHKSNFNCEHIKKRSCGGEDLKTRVFGIFQRDDKVYIEVIPDYNKSMYQAVIRGEAKLESIIHSENWGGYDGLVDLDYKKHYKVHHGNDEFGNNNHIKHIESFYYFAKRRLMKFNGIADATFYLHLKECEFRFNYRNKDIYIMLLKMIRDNPLF